MSEATTPCCRCVPPAIVYPGKCVKCHLSHYDAQRIQIRATEIPFHFFSLGKISWQQHETLVGDIDRIVWATFNRIKNSATLREQSVLCYFEQAILRQVKNLLQQRHNLQLEQQDENVFIKIDPAELLQQLKLDY
jgi:hypothetical protein